MDRMTIEMLKSRFGENAVKFSGEIELDDSHVEEETQEEAQRAEQEGWWKNSTFEIVSRVGFLLGVPEHIFENQHSPLKLEIFRELSQDREASIIRNLCILRTAIEKKYSKINHAIYYDLKNLHTLPEYIPQEALQALSDMGLRIIKANYQLQNYLFDINGHIKNHVGNVRRVFPTWLNFDYVKDLFLMPRGDTAEGCKNAAAEYYGNYNCYPYHVYMNWAPKDKGNLLLNDKKFVTWLYEENQDLFDDMSKVSDISDETRRAIYDFIDSSESVILAVDCENSSAYRLYAALSSLSQEEAEKIDKILLYDDVHTSSTWKLLNRLTAIPTERILAERVVESKSQVDVRLAAGICREHYKNGVSSFILAASDSDYWGLIQEMPDAKFLVMYEYEKCSPSLKAELAQRGIFFCALNDFNTSDARIRELALLYEMEDYLAEHMSVNVKDMFETAITNTRIDMTEVETAQFRRKYIQPMRLSVAEDGTATIVLGR